MVEFIGFIISLLALLYLFIKQNSRTERQAHPPGYPPEEEGKEEDPFKQYLRAIEKEAEAREATQHLPPPLPSLPPKVAKKPKKPPPHSLEERRLQSQIEQRHMKSSLEERHLKSRFNHHEELPGRTLALPANHLHAEEERMVGPSRVQLALRRLSSRRDLIIYQEIVAKPKSMRQ
jgi:outer membrane biosynthesis protein TonB